MKGWMNSGGVSTIHEEEDYDYSSSSSSSSSSSLLVQRIDISSPSTPLRSRVQEWSRARGSTPDAIIHVNGTSFRLHKDPLSKKSGYLKRHLTRVSELTLSPPLNITADTFSLVADFCYGGHIQLTPLNFASLRVAAELLQMTGADGDGQENLRKITESYFRRVVSVSVDLTGVVLRSCLALLPESETTALLVDRCIEALTLMEYGDGIDDFLGDAVQLAAGNFVIVAEAVQRRFASHDLLYRIIDSYLEVQHGKITDKEKVQVCSTIDCGKLTAPLLLHAVQNPKMPLRFIVRAMLQEQLNTRHSILAAGAGGCRQISAARNSTVTLGSLLQRDSAARQTARLKAKMESTSSRIESLEKELDAMRKIISEESEKQRSDRVGSGRSASFRCVIRPSEGKTSRGERGSVSSLSTTFRRRGGDGGGRAVAPSSSSAGSGGESPNAIKGSSGRKNIGRRLIEGIKGVFSASKQAPKKNAYNVYDGLDHFVWIRDGDEDDDVSEEDFRSRRLKNENSYS